MHAIATDLAYPFGLWDDILISSYDMKDVVPFDKSTYVPTSPLSSCSFALLRKGCSYVDSRWRGWDTSNNPYLSTVICKWPLYIGAYAFYMCSALAEIDFPYVTYVENDAFYGINTGNMKSSALSSISLPMCEYIDDAAFFD